MNTQSDNQHPYTLEDETMTSATTRAYAIKGITKIERHEEVDEMSPSQEDYDAIGEIEREQLENGLRGFYGVYASCEVILAGSYHGGDGKEHGFSTRGQSISSSGLWGIETSYETRDTDQAYMDEVFQEEAEDLKDRLRALGVTDDMINNPIEW